jgi:hypothetical protein
MSEPDYILVVEDPGQSIVVADTYVFAAANPLEGVVVVETEAPLVVSIGEAGPTGPVGQPGSAIPPVDFSYGDASPAIVYTLTEDMFLDSVQVVVTTAFNGTGAALSVGKSGQLEAYLAAAQNDPTTTATYETSPDVIIASGTVILLSITRGLVLAPAA